MRRTIKNTVLAAVALTMTLGLTACGGGSSDELTDLAYVEDKGTLVIGLDDTFAPMGFRDEDNELVGLDIDLAKAVGEQMGLEVEFQPIDWSAKEAELEAKNIDCVWNGMSATEDRQKSMSLSNKYLENRILLMSYDDSVNVTSVEQLKDMKIGTQADSAALEAIQKNEAYDTFKDNISEYDTYDAALLDLKAGRVDVVAIDEVYAIYNNQNKERLYESDFNFGADYYAVGFRKEDTELTAAFNDALQAVIEEGKAAEISDKWFGKNLIVFEGYDE